MELHPPFHFLEEIVSISFCSIHCTTFPNAFISLGFHPLCNFPKEMGQTFLDFSPLCNFLREQGQLFLGFTSILQLPQIFSLERGGYISWKNVVNFLISLSSMQLSWEHLLHFSNAFIKGIIGQIASTIILGEMKPFFSNFHSLCNFLKSFP